ncbi:DUF2141 domain-containing protein [bacterium]|nr:DUF2141 domain-containing protein [bacterium]
MSLPACVAALAVSALVISPLMVPNASAEGTSTLTLRVESISRLKGDLHVGLFASEADYGSNKAVSGKVVPVTEGAMSIDLGAVPPGAYAIKLFQDVDGDGTLDTGFFGAPTEPYAFSNNAPARFGPATWADATFEVGPGAASHTISLR